MRNRIASGILTACLFLITGAAVAIAAEEGCVTTDCHDTMGKATYVHGPVGVNACEVCHQLENERDHTFVLRAEKEELCFACHEARRDMMLEDHLHTPVSEGDCVGCHDPHQSEFRFSLKGEAADLCMICHEAAPFEQAHVHGPVAGKDCNACHDPHASAHPQQLLSSADELCFRCHVEQVAMMEKRHVHPPVAEACTNCHDPHSSPAKMLLNEATPELCFSCHDAIKMAATASTEHPPVASGQCGSCHDPHASEYPKLSELPATDLCLSCHTELGEYIAAQEHRHGPVKEGDCNACHDPHGSEHHVILRQYFPREFYMPYDGANYAMCFECHNAEVAVDENTETLTNFRDGDVNLHFLHVNKSEKGRSCRACHQVHASNQEKHIRKSVPFGTIDWELPVNFTKTEHGGSCQVGCHAPKEYSRK